MITEQLNEALRNKLEAAQCITGRLECRMVPSFLLTMRGQRADGKNIFFWELERDINKLLDSYQSTAATDAAAFTIDIDLGRNSFDYNTVSHQQAAAQKDKEARDQKAEEAHRLQELKQMLLSRNIPYGLELAEQVAAALSHGALCYSHRDYCGMGLEKNTDGNYVYAAVWDGWLEPVHTFNSRQAFVQWLAVQSDASLSRVNEPDTWLWNNQVINRQRLEEFVSWRQHNP
ncbi:hypothetical protein MRBLMN1_003082 [Chitinophaga ginsengisegetis]|uniref:hypothetical protein n=1 Tax=Chitinophaga ginsengisegetis TaxID=393003 RepID=UPI0034249F09